MVVCVECAKSSTGKSVDWRAYLTVDGEVAVYCPDCAEREFGERSEGRAARRDEASDR